MNSIFRSATVSIILFLTIAHASAGTWRDPMYGGVYNFTEDGVVTVTHPGQEFKGKWWPETASAIKFRLYDKNGRLLGTNSLEMTTESTAYVHIAGASRTYRWNLIDSRGGPGEILDPTESGWFMEALRF